MTYSALHAQFQTFRPDPAIPLALFQANPDYRETPVLDYHLDRAPGCRLRIKDERSRLGLPSFKALGGIHAVSRIIGKSWHAHTGQHLAPMDYRNRAVRQMSASITFVCASAGNHGLAVARGAALFGAAARVHLAATVPEVFAARLRAEGAQVVRSGVDYEESMALARRDAESSGAILLADSSWPGYLEAPALIMEGYTVLAEELRAHFIRSPPWPSRVYLQAGVGGLAAAIACMIRDRWAVQPQIVVVEPDVAPCLRDSVAAGHVVRVEGPVSAMGRLDCKEPSLLALQVLSGAADRFMVVTDAQADAAKQHLATLGVATTTSGAAGYAGLLADAERAGESDTVLTIVSEAAF